VDYDVAADGGEMGVGPATQIGSLSIRNSPTIVEGFL